MRLRLLPFMLLLAACPGDDDDSAIGDDDDTGDDDTGDDDTGDDDDTADDDDTGDDDTSGDDLDDATVPMFTCDPSQNQFMLTLGDGSSIGPFGGVFASPASFANNNGQWTLRLGQDTVFAQLQGNNAGSVYPLNTDIALQAPASTAGHVIVNVVIDASQLGSAPAFAAGGYGLPAANADPRVLGSANFTAAPAPNGTVDGRFSAILQHQQQLMAGNTVLLGIAGCFQTTLAPTD